MITDLTGTTWILNNSIVISDDLLVEISFTSSLGDHSNFLLYKTYYNALVYAGPLNDNSQYTNSTFVYRTSSGGVNEDYRTITFTSEASNHQDSLIEGLLANATQVLPPDYIDKVVLTSGDEYYFKDTISGYLSSSDLVAGTNISIEENSEGKAIISSSSSARVRIIRLPEPTISDLTDTVGVFKSSEDLATVTPSSTKEFNVSFGDGNFGENVKLAFSLYSDNNSLEIGYYSTEKGCYGAYDGSGNEEVARVIHINSGSDVTNSELIRLLSEYAYRVDIDLSNCAGIIFNFNSVLNLNILDQDLMFPFTTVGEHDEEYTGDGISISSTTGVSYREGDSFTQGVYNTTSYGTGGESFRRITLTGNPDDSDEFFNLGTLAGVLINATIVS